MDFLSDLLTDFVGLGRFFCVRVELSTAAHYLEPVPAVISRMPLHTDHYFGAVVLYALDAHEPSCNGIRDCATC